MVTVVSQACGWIASQAYVCQQCCVACAHATVHAEPFSSKAYEPSFSRGSCTTSTFFECREEQQRARRAKKADEVRGARGRSRILVVVCDRSEGEHYCKLAAGGEGRCLDGSPRL